ncbi:phosphotransferase family protein [Lihuaxuella thermophila]|uniref:Phosphotransferase enzyme family protein n=1 Tax=Lihuaxuella thermophila TaxID=1173111 RepID=A0A1H8FJG0_9BACL|nr:phosphotransferase family protein [Lihuaxuella thermophila]SEN32041.1 Phosphotransferase enzyme family protein [Lihuaxuella thermophila]
MNQSMENKMLARLVHRKDPQSKLLRTWELKGGVSAQVTALEPECPNGQKKKMVVRRHGETDMKRNPHIAADEYKLLKMLQSAGLPVPKPYYLEPSGEVISTPCIVIEFIEGKTEFKPTHLDDYILQLATNLAKIHSLDCSNIDRSFLPDQEGVYTKMITNRPAILDELLNEGRIRDAIESAWPVTQRNPSVILHGDYWPGNLLWRNGQLVAVIDWEDAAVGDPLADVANTRLEILWHFGIQAMNEFTYQYQSIMRTIDFAKLPYWDLCAALRLVFKLSTWGLDEKTLNTMRERHQLLVNQAIEKIS